MPETIVAGRGLLVLLPKLDGHDFAGVSGTAHRKSHFALQHHVIAKRTRYLNISEHCDNRQTECEDKRSRVGGREERISRKAHNYERGKKHRKLHAQDSTFSMNCWTERESYEVRQDGQLFGKA